MSLFARAFAVVANGESDTLVAVNAAALPSAVKAKLKTLNAAATRTSSSSPPSTSTPRAPDACVPKESYPPCKTHNMR